MAQGSASSRPVGFFHEKSLERVLVLCGIAYVLLFFDVVYSGAATWLDNRLMTGLILLPEGFRLLFGVLFSFPGESWLLALIVAVVALRAWWKGSRATGLLVAASAASLAIFVTFSKWVVARHRPETFFAGDGMAWIPQWMFPTSMAFPSGHSAAPVLVYGLALIVLWGRGPDRDSLLPLPKRVPSWALGTTAVLAFLPGVGRILWGVHWVSDVVAGWALGLAWLCGTLIVAMVWQRSRAESEPETGEVEAVSRGTGGLFDDA